MVVLKKQEVLHFNEIAEEWNNNMHRNIMFENLHRVVDTAAKF